MTKALENLHIRRKEIIAASQYDHSFACCNMVRKVNEVHVNVYKAPANQAYLAEIFYGWPHETRQGADIALIEPGAPPLYRLRIKRRVRYIDLSERESGAVYLQRIGRAKRPADWNKTAEVNE